VNLLFTLGAYLPFIGGAQLLMHQLARQLQARGSVHVATLLDRQRYDWLLGTTLRLGRGRTYDVDGIPVHRLGFSRTERLHQAPWVASYWALQGVALPRLAGALRPQLDALCADADLVHNCRIGREPLSYASWQAARARDIPFVFTPIHHPRWGGWLHRAYQRLYREADAVIALTEAERRTLLALGVREERVFVTGTGPMVAAQAEPARFRERHHLGTAPVVLFLGQKYAYKGVGTLLDAAPVLWRSVPDARLVFVGPRTPDSERRFASVTDSRVVEVDAVSLQEKTDALAACDVLCVPSSQESFGAVFTEAWTFGRPVVGGDIPAVRDVVDQGVDGLLVPQEPGAVADALAQLLRDEGLRHAMGARGKAKVEARFTWPRLAARTEDVYWRVRDGRIV
jgi:glycosyltransferase involved in cell wall biosynthesis